VSIVLIGVAIALAAFLFLNTAAPRTLTITSGPAGSSFQRTAERYQKILERDGVTLKILPFRRLGGKPQAPGRPKAARRHRLRPRRRGRRQTLRPVACRSARWPTSR
jgi:hypothetical protein